MPPLLAPPWHRFPALAVLVRAAIVVCLLAVSLHGVATAAIMVPPVPNRPKDFSLVKKDGVYHLFYIRNNVGLPAAQTEIDFGHATSPDLYFWTQQPTVLAVDTAGWDNAHVWAPSVFKSEGLWWMLYTGVSERPGEFAATQRIGLAVSSDLQQWTRVGSGPVFDSPQVPWAWSPPLSAYRAFRDPFVMPDPDVPGEWLVYYTVTPATDTMSTIVGVGRTVGGSLNAWADLKPLWITHHSYTYNTLTESPHVFEHNGIWFMFFTSNAGQPLTFYSGVDPTGDPAAWNYRGRLRNMLGYDTGTWFASEHLRDGLHDYFAFVSGDRVDIREIQWLPPQSFSLTAPELFHVRTLKWGATQAAERDTVALLLHCANPYSGSAQIEAVVVDANGLESPAPLDSLGLLEYPEVLTDSVAIPFVARRWPATSDTDAVMRLRVRMVDRTAETGLLTVHWAPVPIGDPESGGGGPPVYQPPDPGPGYQDPDAGIEDRPRTGGRLWSISHVPIVGGSGLVLAFDAPTAARVELFDLQGRGVRLLADRVLPKGTTLLPWDGRDDRGVTVPRGVYFARVQAGASADVVRLLVGF